MFQNIGACHCTNQCRKCGACCRFTCAHRGGHAPVGTFVWPDRTKVHEPSEPTVAPQMGWRCPCGRSYAPFVTECTHCRLVAESAERGTTINTPSVST